MKQLKYKIVTKGTHFGVLAPLNIILVDQEDVKACGLSNREALHVIAAQFEEPSCINIFDMNAVTTTSDGLVVEGALVDIAASDRRKINSEFGMLTMIDVPYTEKRIEEEPHLRQWRILYPERHLIMGPVKKNVPVHCCAMTGRACNNNSATEIWDVVTMEEMLLPVLGQLEIMRGGSVMVGKTGGVISVGIGMVVGEEYARILSNRAFMCGQTAHKSGVKAQTLKAHIPLIACDKTVLAKYIVQALEVGMVPGRDIGASPAVLSVARLLDSKIDYDNIEPSAYEELASVGCTKEWITDRSVRMSAEEIVASARDIIPGGEDITFCRADELAETRYMEVNA